MGWLRTPVIKSLLGTLRRAGAVVGGFSFFAGEAEVHLFLEAVHLGDLHFHFVAQAEHAAIAPARELTARFVELVEIVRKTGAVNQPAHREAGHVHEETEVAHVNHQRGIHRRFRHRQLRFQERIHLHVLAVALGVGGIAFGVGDVFGGFLKSLTGNYERCCGLGFWVGARRRRRSIPNAGCND